MWPGLLLHFHVAFLLSFFNLYFQLNTSWTAALFSSDYKAELQLNITDNSYTYNDVWLHNIHKNCTVSLIVETARWSTNWLAASYVADGNGMQSSSFRPFVFEGDDMQLHWHLHGLHVSSIFSLSAEQRCIHGWCCLWAALHEKDLWKPQGTTVIHQWCVAIATW